AIGRRDGNDKSIDVFHVGSPPCVDCRLESAERGSRPRTGWEPSSAVEVPRRPKLACALRCGDELAKAREVFAELLANALVDEIAALIENVAGARDLQAAAEVGRGAERLQHGQPCRLREQ